jgi:6-phosphogluconolactonase
MKLLGVSVLAAAGFATSVASQQASELLVYFGTYTGEKSKGIYVSRFNLASGALSAPELAAETPSPSYLAVHPNQRFLYAANEVSKFGGLDSGSVTAFGIDRGTGKLRQLNQQASKGGGPAHVIVDGEGRNVLVANYGGGSVAALPIGADGALAPATGFVQHTGSGVDPKRQAGPHAHSVNVDPKGRFAYVADLGLDKILVYRFGAKDGSIAPADPPFATVPPGAGPRHFAFHSSGQFAYVINEMNLTITAFAVDAARGALKELQTVPTLPAGEEAQQGFSTADVQVHPSGRFLYGSNRGHNTIVVFAIDQKSGKLNHVEHEPTQGSTPRAFGIDPQGHYLLAANQRSDSVIVFRIDQQTGALTPTGHSVQVGSPVCIRFVLP